MHTTFQVFVRRFLVVLTVGDGRNECVRAEMGCVRAENGVGQNEAENHVADDVDACK